MFTHQQCPYGKLQGMDGCHRYRVSILDYMKRHRGTRDCKHINQT